MVDLVPGYRFEMPVTTALLISGVIAGLWRRSRAGRSRLLADPLIGAGLDPIEPDRLQVGLAALARWLVILGVGVVVLGLLWPWLTRLGLGRLPGDIVVERDNFRLYIPITTALLISVGLSKILWLLNR